MFALLSRWYCCCDTKSGSSNREAAALPPRVGWTSLRRDWDAVGTTPGTEEGLSRADGEGMVATLKPDVEDGRGQKI